MNPADRRKDPKKPREERGSPRQIARTLGMQWARGLLPKWLESFKRMELDVPINFAERLKRTMIRRARARYGWSGYARPHQGGRECERRRLRQERDPRARCIGTDAIWHA